MKNKVLLKDNISDFVDMTSRMARLGSWSIKVSSGEIQWSAMTGEILDASDDYIPDSAGIENLFNPKDLTKLKEAFNSALTDRQPFDMVLNIMSFAGNDLVIRVIGIPDVSGEECSEITGFVHDITEPTRSKAEIVKREKMLRAGANVTQELLSNPDYMAAIRKSLTTLGEAVGVDSVYLFKTDIDDSNRLRASLLFEWNSENSACLKDSRWLDNVSVERLQEGFPELLQNKPVSADINDTSLWLPLKEYMGQNGIRSVLIIPVFIGDFLGGYVGYDE